MTAPTWSAIFHDARPRRRSAQEGPCFRFGFLRRLGLLRRRPSIALPRADAISPANRSATKPATIDVDGCGSERVLPSTASPLLNTASTTMPVLTLVTSPPA